MAKLGKYIVGQFYSTFNQTGLNSISTTQTVTAGWGGSRHLKLQTESCKSYCLVHEVGGPPRLRLGYNVHIFEHHCCIGNCVKI